VTPPAGCAQGGGGLRSVSSVAVSSDGRNVYVTGPESSAVVSFARDRVSGDLNQLGCVSGDGNYRQDPDCAPGRAIQYAQRVAVSPDGAHVVVAATDSHSLILFARDPATGALTQLPAFDGCIGDATNGPAYCQPGLGLALPIGLAFSPDGRHLFTGSFGHGSVAAFAREPTSGLLSQIGPCISQHDLDCEPAAPLERAGSIAASPDGRHVYVTASSAIVAFAVEHDVRFPDVQVFPSRPAVELSCPVDAAGGCLGTIESAIERKGLRDPWSDPVVFDLSPGEADEFALPALAGSRVAIQVKAAGPTGEPRVFVRPYSIAE
jgi:6-phosphogluconolactonase (cycloisomerase 2 family)